jgi:hypothetical protein
VDRGPRWQWVARSSRIGGTECDFNKSVGEPLQFVSMSAYKPPARPLMDSGRLSLGLVEFTAEVAKTQPAVIPQP